jgi:hypothetical protein
MKTVITVVVLLTSFAWSQSTSKTTSALPTLEDCAKTATAAAKLLDDLGKAPDARKKAEMLHSRASDKVEMRLASCRMVAMSHADITLVNEYADLETWLKNEDYDTLRELTKALQAECR